MTGDAAARKARRATLERLRTARRHVLALCDQLERLHLSHEARGGFHRFRYVPTCGEQWRALSASLMRIRREAAQGCPDSCAFLATWEEAIALADHMRHERPPEKEPGWKPIIPDRPSLAEVEARIQRAAANMQRKRGDTSRPLPDFDTVRDLMD